MATIDRFGMCIISDVDSNSCRFHLNLSSDDEVGKILLVFISLHRLCCNAKDIVGRCRWSTNAGEPFLFVKYNSDKFDIIDVEKKILTMKNPSHREKFGNLSLLPSIKIKRSHGLLCLYAVSYWPTITEAVNML